MRHEKLSSVNNRSSHCVLGSKSSPSSSLPPEIKNLQYSRKNIHGKISLNLVSSTGNMRFEQKSWPVMRESLGYKSTIVVSTLHISCVFTVKACHLLTRRQKKSRPICKRFTSWRKSTCAWARDVSRVLPVLIRRWDICSARRKKHEIG